MIQPPPSKSKEIYLGNLALFELKKNYVSTSGVIVSLLYINYTRNVASKFFKS